VLFIDLNRFKLINDTLGRQIGDELLRPSRKRFRTVLRDQDLVARLGGDEFAVGPVRHRPAFRSQHGGAKTAGTLNAPFHHRRTRPARGRQHRHQRLSAGRPRRRNPAAPGRHRHARAKQEGGAEAISVAFYSQDMNQGMQERMRIESGLRHALGNGELLLHYQPKYSISDGKIIGAEALVRWRHPERGLVPPIEFIPLAEATGLIVQVGEWVLEAACAQAQVWKDAGLPPIRLAVNVSAREFTSALPGRVTETLKRYGLEPSWLELEITESTLMHNIDRVIGIMDRITATGVTLSLDDFGTGYSSLSYLKRFPIDTLKIDRSFTIGIPGDVNDCAIANTIISIAQQLKHKVIAEGVETVEQLAFLKNSGCDEVQGYLFSKPLGAEEFEQALRENWAPGQSSRAA
jgi:EAL domain-containing protein (putative c-di-GMP-specific phosphodiesterase class I)/GGDEF domain-containing protein